MKLYLEKIDYDYEDLDPVMSKDTLKYHRDNLAASYVDRFNEGKGDTDFNKAGAFLHNIFFPQFRPSNSSNKPYGKALDVILGKYKSFDSFKEEFQKVAMKIQGSGWVYMNSSGEIKTIKNHAIRNDIVLLVDWWEHAWALDYQSDKRKYLKNIWKIIDWSVINDRLNISVKASRKNNLLEILKIAEDEMSMPKRTPKEFRRWLREKCYAHKLDSRMALGSRCRLSNYFFNQETDENRLRIYNQWKNSKRTSDGRVADDHKETPESNEGSIEIAQELPRQMSLFEEDV
jgi:Fe-Mn family superoxide dismutase|tara:strand:- start:4119 stop:4982 length:864 start_codon:yes stop_codon:yes gene_type:complete